MKQYDVTVIGAGATGASIAWQLSHYDLKVALVDRCADASFGVSKANSGIVHGGFHHSADSTLKAKLELEGNPMFDDLKKELDSWRTEKTKSPEVQAHCPQSREPDDELEEVPEL